jgi:hypothetical protein
VSPERAETTQPVSPHAPQWAPGSQPDPEHAPGSPAAGAPMPAGSPVPPPQGAGPSWPDNGSQFASDETTAQFGATQHQQWSPTSGPPYPWQPGPLPMSPSGPTDQYGLAADVEPMSGAGLGGSSYARRITPSPPQPRGKLVMGLVIGLVAGIVLAGTTGFFIGRGTGRGGGEAVAAHSTQPSYLGDLMATNRAKFGGELATLAQPWLADMSGCLANTDSGGPQLGKGEQVHVLCRDGGMYIHFVTYASADQKATDRGYRQQLALGSQAILPGLEQPGRKLGGVTGAAGTYVEYATRAADNPALCGVWWDLDNTASAVYVDVLCDSLGGKWDPLRAVWQRHS